MMSEVNSTPDEIEQCLERWIEQGQSVPEAMQAVLTALRAHRAFWDAEPAFTKPTSGGDHTRRAEKTYGTLNQAANDYDRLKATEFMRRITLAGNGLCTHTRTVVPADSLTLTWVDELVWRDDAEDGDGWWSQRVRWLGDICPCCRTLLARDSAVVAVGVSDDKIYRRNPLVHEAKYEGEQLLVKGLRFDVHEPKEALFEGDELTTATAPWRLPLAKRRPTVDMVPTGTDEWFEWQDGAFTEYTDRRKGEYPYWLTNEMADEVGLAPHFTVFAPAGDDKIKFGKLQATLRPSTA